MSVFITTVVRSGIMAVEYAPAAFSRQSVGERVGAELELHDLAGRAFAGLQVEGRAVAVGGPEPAPLPARLRVVDAAVEPLGVKAHRVGDPQVHPLAADEREKRLV